MKPCSIPTVLQLCHLLLSAHRHKMYQEVCPHTTLLVVLLDAIAVLRLSPS